MSVNKKSKRIDLDAGDNLFHLKVKTSSGFNPEQVEMESSDLFILCPQAKSSDIFYIWLTKLCAHRVFRKNEALSVHRGVLHALSLGQSTMPAMSSLSQHNSAVSIQLLLLTFLGFYKIHLIKLLMETLGFIPAPMPDTKI